ncbi:phage tail tape measure protein [Actinacidiphila sp. ITFR-21]|uniref:phage tail tape measure protein n=1 Tax=Actinacidiphila sp. ITFR-21 TaxID=3075199 RepID=UPI00288B0DA3|nr:phage tail tape measure protein [Streptomyces sp. ITFR-21]WNI16611.1 phage tail tape measure protein [Streptomyces sp. ITFR-21]
MADRTVRVRVLAEFPAYGAQMTRAAGQTAAFGRSAVAAGRGVRVMGADAAAAGGGLTAAGAAARSGAAGLREADLAAVGAGRNVRVAGAAAAGTVSAFARMGAAARGGFAAVRTGAASVLAPVRSLGLLLAGGAIFYGVHRIVEQGNEYVDSQNKFLEVSRASGAEMASMGREAQALGSDMRLPSATAAEAADAMVDLTKAGLGAQDAIKAARGTIQLSAAARTDVATSAKIEGDIMDQFALKADQAAHVADVLANTSNSASGELMDIYYAMKYVGPTAHALGISLDDVATTVGLLGKSGIIGETAGTSLRGTLVNLAKATPQMKKGLKELGIEAFDEQGKFKGLRYVISELHDAQERLTAEQFTSAAAMAFGKPALSAMTALAHQGGEAFDQYSKQVSRSGGAAAIAAAESKGLGGAMRGLGKQLSSVFLQVYLGIAPTFEKITRGMTASVSDAIPYVKRGVTVAGNLWELYGPAAQAKLSSAKSGIRRAAQDLAGPVEDILKGGAVTGTPLVVSSVQALDKAMHNASGAVAPLESGLHDVATSVASGSGALGVFSGRAQVAVGWLGDMTGVLGPIGQVVGDLAHDFASLPGPIQLSVISMLALRPFRSQITGMQSAVTGFGRRGIAAFRGIGDASLYQRVQAANAGVTLGRFGGAMAELEQRSPVIRRMGDSFRSTSGSIQQAGGRLVGFRAAAGGAATAIGTGAKAGLLGAGRGLVSFMGGPWGIALAGAMVGLDLFARHQQKAAEQTRETQQRVSSLSEALRNSSQVIDSTVRDIATQNLMQQKSADSGKRLVDLARTAKVPMRDLVNAYLGQGTSLGTVRKQLDAVAAAQSATFTKPGTGGDTYTVYTRQGAAAHELAGQLTGLSGDYRKAVQDARDYQDAVAAGQAPTSRLSDAIDTLAQASADADTKARALHTALDLLSGGELDVQAAVADQNQAILDLNSAWQEGVDKAKGYKEQLLQVDGSLNTTTANGQALWTKMQGLNESTAGAAQATYDYARSQGTAVVPALRQAEKAMESSWKTAVTAATKFGLTTEQAQILAAQMGFIPSNLAITMSTPGLDETTKDLLYVQGLAGHLPKDSKIRVTALTAEATKDITALGFKVHTLPGGRQMEITAPTAKAARGLDDLIAKKLPGKQLDVSVDTAQSITDLDTLQSAIGRTRGRTVRIDTLTKDAQKALETLGFTIQHTQGKQIQVTIPTGSAKSSRDLIQSYVNSLSGRTVTVTINAHRTGINPDEYYSQGPHKGSANGNIFSAYARGGIERHVAQIAPGGAMRLWAEPETGGEAYIPLTPSKRIRSTAILRQVAKQFGYDLDAFAEGGFMKYAAGGLDSFTYTPAEPPATFGSGAGMDRYTTAVQRLQDAWTKLTSALADQATKTKAVRDAEKNLDAVRSGKHTAKQLADAETKLTSAREASAKAAKAVTADRSAVYAADANLGVRKGAKAPTGFDLAAYSKQLADAQRLNHAWESNLAAVGKRAGADVEQTLRDMGQDGQALVQALAHASGKSFKDIVANLKALAPTAKAALADYTSQLKASASGNKAFQANLLKLAGMGYGDLAAQLAAQGDDNAASIAAAAVTSPSGAKAAAAAASAAASALSSDDLTNALTLISVLRARPGRGIADVIAAGLDWGTIQALVPKLGRQLSSLPKQDTAMFLQQVAAQGAAGGVAMARGGILDRPTTVTAAEAGTVESWIPWNGSDRSRQLLARTATAFGYHLTPVRQSAAAPVVQHTTTKHYETHLHGAGQTTAEQAADVARHMAFLT